VVPPFLLQEGDTIGVVLSYRVMDCAAAKQRGVPLPVQVQSDGVVRTLNVGSKVPYLDQWRPDVGALVKCPSP
jgi:hypothetical protein